MSQAPCGIFVTGTDTDVGKTYVSALIARALVAQGVRVGVYKPAASGCRSVEGVLVTDDAAALWNAAGQPGTLEAVCPQRFAAPLAPHLAAQAEGKRIDTGLLRSGLDAWRGYDFVIVEGAGGLLSPITHDELVADVAAEFGYPLVIVAANRIGVVNQALMTLSAARHHARPLEVQGVVLNEARATTDDPSVATNALELERLLTVPLVADLRFGETSFPEAGLALLKR